MASLYKWMKAVNPSSTLPVPKTTETYSKIKELGLETVLWEEFSEVKSITSISKILSFIWNNKPCLFIYDPKREDVQKGYLFNVKSFFRVLEWRIKITKI